MLSGGERDAGEHQIISQFLSPVPNQLQLDAKLQSASILTVKLYAVSAQASHMHQMYQLEEIT